jgi:hypothetical protein
MRSTQIQKSRSFLRVRCVACHRAAVVFRSKLLDQRINQANEEDDIHGIDLGNDQNNNTHGIDLGNDHGIDQNNKPNDNTENLGDTGHHEDATTTKLETSIELIKRNRPLLDRLGKFGKVLENLLEFGTAVSEVNSPSSLSEIQLSNRPTE